MGYKIAVGTSDGENIDLKFGEVAAFHIYEVEGKSYHLQEIRPAGEETGTCGTTGCASGGCSGDGHGCSGPNEILGRVEKIADCRCIVCKKIGFQAQKQFEKKAISVFDIDCPIKEALEKISGYYDKIDRHESIRRSR